MIGGKEFKPGSRTRGVLDAGFYFPDIQIREYIRRVVQIPYTVIRGAVDGRMKKMMEMGYSHMDLESETGINQRSGNHITRKVRG